MRHSFAVCLLGIVLAVSPKSFANDSHGVGEKAPPIDLQEVLQAPKGTAATLEGLKGKVVVLEFWATWCPTCVKSIPHFNELADELKDQPIQFIAVTDEAREQILTFLGRQPIHGWVGLNSTGSMFSAYDINGRPLTVVIRPDGVVDARIVPDAGSFPIRARNLLNLLEGKPSGLVSPRVVYSGEVRDPRGKPLAGVSVRVTNRTGGDDWILIGDARTSGDGHFRIDQECSASYINRINDYPIRLQFTSPDFLYGRLEDLRLFSPEQQADLRINVREGSALSGRVVDREGHAVSGARVLAVFPGQDDDRKSVLTDADGKFELRGLPTGTAEINVITPHPRSPLLSGKLVVDSHLAAAGITIVAVPALPPDKPIHSALGMKLVDVDKDLQAKLFLAQDGILVLDPGPHPERLGMGKLRRGDCFKAEGEHAAADVESLCRTLLALYGQKNGESPARLTFDVALWGDAFSMHGEFETALKEDDVAELRR